MTSSTTRAVEAKLILNVRHGKVAVILDKYEKYHEGYQSEFFAKIAGDAPQSLFIIARDR